MAHFAFLCVPARGHLAPLASVALELVRRGHRATFLHHPDLEPSIRAFGLDFVPLDAPPETLGALAPAIARAGELRGWIGIRPLIRDFAQGIAMLCETAPDALRTLGADMIVSDWIEPAGGLVARHLDLPYVSIAAALPFNWSPGDASPFLGWPYRPGRVHRYANMAAQWVAERVQSPIHDVIETYAKHWQLEPVRRVQHWASSFAQIAQLTPSLDFPRRSLIGCFHYCGPLRYPPHRAAGRGAPRAGRRRAFASLGSLLGHRAEIFEWIADAAESHDLDLTIAHGGLLAPTAAERLARRATVHAFVDYAQILPESDIAIMHGGMNGVLDALTHGVPLVVVPVAHEQGAIAARARRAGVGRVCPPLARRGRLAATVAEVLADPSYARAAARIGDEIAAAGGAATAADIIEQVARTGQPCLNAQAVASDSRLAPYALGAR